MRLKGNENEQGVSEREIDLASQQHEVSLKTCMGPLAKQHCTQKPEHGSLMKLTGSVSITKFRHCFLQIENEVSNSLGKLNLHTKMSGAHATALQNQDPLPRTKCVLSYFKVSPHPTTSRNQQQKRTPMAKLTLLDSKCTKAAMHPGRMHCEIRFRTVSPADPVMRILPSCGVHVLVTFGTISEVVHHQQLFYFLHILDRRLVLQM